jgi:UDP-3-O-[3-hydroxymyristoyl] N-acetylglucosamine deacetylase
MSIPIMSFMERQKTIKRRITFEGIGLHTGKESALTLEPADENIGILFRIDGKEFYVNITNVCDTLQNISLCFGERKVMTVEHLFSVFTGLGIDNLVIEINYGEEVPILDGSAYEFVKAIKEVGLVEQSVRREYFYIDREFRYTKSEDQYLVLKPSDRLIIDYEIDFEFIGKEKLRLEVTPETYEREISKARTFGFLEDAERLKRTGLALGADLSNVHVYSKADRKFINQDRYPDESVRHKILDLLGAIAIFRPSLTGEFIARKSGHTMDVALLKEVYFTYFSY